MAPPTLPPPRRFLTVVLVSVAAFSILFRGAGARETRFPIQVAQDGTAVEFVYDSAKDDLAASVINFCAKHLPGADVKDCSENLLDQVGAYDDFREESLQQLPSLSFAVNTGAATFAGVVFGEVVLDQHVLHEVVHVVARGRLERHGEAPGREALLRHVVRVGVRAAAQHLLRQAVRGLVQLVHLAHLLEH